MTANRKKKRCARQERHDGAAMAATKRLSRASPDAPEDIPLTARPSHANIDCADEIFE